MRWRQVVLLYAVLAALGVLYLREREVGQPGEPDRPVRPRFLQLAGSDIGEIAMRRGDRQVRFRREGDEWTVVEPVGAVLPRDLVTGFLQALLTAEEIEPIVATTRELEGFGLDARGDQVELRLTRGAEPVVVTLGVPNPTGTALYARREADGAVVLIGRRVRDYEDMIYNALPRGRPPGAPDGRVGQTEPLILKLCRV